MLESQGLESIHVYMYTCMNFTCMTNIPINIHVCFTKTENIRVINLLTAYGYEMLQF